MHIAQPRPPNTHLLTVIKAYTLYSLKYTLSLSHGHVIRRSRGSEQRKLMSLTHTHNNTQHQNTTLHGQLDENI